MPGIVDFRTVLEDPDGNNITRENPLPVTGSALESLRRIASLLKPLQQITGGGSNRLSVDVNSGSVNVGTVTTVTTATTVGTVNNIAAIGAVSGFDTAKAISRQAFNSGIRSRIS